MTDMSKDEALRRLREVSDLVLAHVDFFKNAGLAGLPSQLYAVTEAISRPAPLPEDLEELVERLRPALMAYGREWERQGVHLGKHGPLEGGGSPMEAWEDALHPLERAVAVECQQIVADALRTQAAALAEKEAEIKRLRDDFCPMSPECAPKGVPVLVSGGIAMKKTGGQWFTGMEDPAFERPIQWEVKWWARIPQASELSLARAALNEKDATDGRG
jgi:hypothetical protein